MKNDNEFLVSMTQIELMINSHDESVGKYVIMNRVNKMFTSNFRTSFAITYIPWLYSKVFLRIQQMLLQLQLEQFPRWYSRLSCLSTKADTDYILCSKENKHIARLFHK